MKIEVKNLKVGDIFYMTCAFTEVRKYRVDSIVGKTDCPVVRTSEWSKDKGSLLTERCLGCLCGIYLIVKKRCGWMRLKNYLNTQTKQ